MVNPVSSTSTLYPGVPTQPTQTQPKAHPPQDTVQLSAAAKSSLGDVDHDGDSH